VFSNYFKVFFVLMMLLLSTFTKAEQKVALGTWDVHYMALNSTFLTPQVAQQYAIIRSKYNGLINISILDKKTQSAQSVSVIGEAQNLLGVVKHLAFKEVQEGDAIYYLAVLPFSDQEHYRISIQINDGKTQQKFSFEQKFYAE
jgi:hypothetical protein